MKSKIFLYDCLIGERLRFYRKKRGLTQVSLSAMIGISAQQIQKYEIGKNRISASRIKQLAEILDIPVHYFLTDPRELPKDKKNSFNDGGPENGAGKLVYYYSLIKSEKLRKLLIQSSAIYVENGM